MIFLYPSKDPLGNDACIPIRCKNTYIRLLLYFYIDIIRKVTINHAIPIFKQTGEWDDLAIYKFTISLRFFFWEADNLFSSNNPFALEYNSLIHYQFHTPRTPDYYIGMQSSTWSREVPTCDQMIIVIVIVIRIRIKSTTYLGG